MLVQMVDLDLQGFWATQKPEEFDLRARAGGRIRAIHRMEIPLRLAAPLAVKVVTDEFTGASRSRWIEPMRLC